MLTDIDYMLTNKTIAINTNDGNFAEYVLVLNSKSKTRYNSNFQNILKLNNRLLKKSWIKEKIITEIRIYSIQNKTWYVKIFWMKLKYNMGIFIVLKGYIRNIKFQINDLHLYLRKLEK